MANIRKCPKCGKIENAYTYFCTECGTKTVEYSDDRQNQQFQDQQVLKDNNKCNVVAGDLSRSSAEKIEKDNPVAEENTSHETPIAESQNAQSINETTNVNEPVDRVVTKNSFKWGKKYKYICGAAGVCLIIGILFLQLLGSKKATSSQDNLTQVNNETQNTYSESVDLTDDSNSDVVTSYDVSDNTEEQENESELIYEEELEKEHYYELYIEDCTWEEAYQACLDRGGYLIRIDSTEEYYSIISQIEQQGYQNKIFWLGGAQYDGKYWWVYHDNDKNSDWVGDVCLNEDYPFNDLWLDGEPSYYDDQTNTYEDKMDMFYASKLEKWIWNDVPNDILSVVTGYSGKIGYICEYEY